MRNLLTELAPSMHGNSHVFDPNAAEQSPLNSDSTAAEVSPVCDMEREAVDKGGIPDTVLNQGKTPAPTPISIC